MRVADHVEMLELETTLADGPGRINPLIVWDESDAILFDAGMPNMGTDIERMALSAGVPFDQLNRILITHSDMDHVGSLAQIVRKSSRGVAVFAHEKEKPYIECDVLPIRLKQMEQYANLTTGKRHEQLAALAENLKRSYKLFRADVNRTVKDGEVLPYCGGITCIHTPGHTPGHMSYYLNGLNLLVAGDILQIANNTLMMCPDFTMVDREAAHASLKKLCRFNIGAVVCYHGGLYQGNVAQCIEELEALK